MRISPKLFNYILPMLISVILLSSMSLHAAGILSQQQQNMLKAWIDNEYLAASQLQQDSGNNERSTEFLIFKPSVSVSTVSKAQINGYILRQLSLRAATVIDELPSVISTEAEQFPLFSTIDVPWLGFAILSQSVAAPTFLCQQNDDICRYFTGNDEHFSKIDLSLLKQQRSKVAQAAQLICELQNNCTATVLQKLTRQISREAASYNDKKADEQLSELLDQFKLEFNEHP